jgi:hypothetical protein
MNSDDIYLASRSLPGIVRPAPGDAPVLSPATGPTVLSPELLQAIAKGRPTAAAPQLEMSWQEQASLLQRLNINKNRGERIGPATSDGEGRFTIPVFDKQGNVVGGTTVYRENGQLKGGFAKENSGIDGSAEAIAPTISGGRNSWGKENVDNDGNFKDSDTWSLPTRVEAGAKAGAKGALVEVQSGSFTINPDGSGRGSVITTGAIKGELNAKGAGEVGFDHGKFGANAAMGLEGNAHVASATYKAEAFGGVKPTDDPNVCTQWTGTAEGGAHFGLGGTAMAQFGTDGVKAKIGATAGPGLSLGGSVARPEVECRVQNQVIGADQTISGTSPEADKVRSQLIEGVQTSSSPEDYLANTKMLSSSDYAPTNTEDIPTSSYLTPKYGNYCGPDWIGGMYDAGNVCRVDWKPPGDAMDEACRDHDYDYIRSDLSAQTPNTNPDKQAADLELLDKVAAVPNSDLDTYGDIYKQGVDEVFGYKTGTGGSLVAIDQAIEGVKDAWDWTKNNASDAWDWTKDKASDAWDSTFGDDPPPNDGSPSPGALGLQPMASMGSGGGGESISGMETEADDLSQEAHSHADRAESAARQAQAAARRAAAIAARIRAMTSRRYS